MAFIKEVSYAKKISIKVAEYQYEKHRISIVGVLEEGDTHNDILEQLKSEVNEQIKEIKDNYYGLDENDDDEITIF